MFDKFDVLRLNLDLIQSFIVDLLSVTLDLQMQFDFQSDH